MNTETETVGNQVQEPVIDQVQEQQPQEVSKETPEVEKVDSQSENWRKANDLLRFQQREIEQLKAELSKKAEPIKPEVDEFADLDPDDVLTVKQAKDFAKKFAEKTASNTAQQVVQEYIQQQNIQKDEEIAREKFEDYDFVVENFAVSMIKNDPALAYKIQNSKNPAQTAYKLAKLSDEYEAAMTKKGPNAKAEKILKNSSRPTSAAAVSGSLKAQADSFSNLSKQEIWEQSQKFARGA